jgi:peptidyl-prolyl cis-trans isomerase A (cyclophilin A)
MSGRSRVYPLVITVWCVVALSCVSEKKGGPEDKSETVEDAGVIEDELSPALLIPSLAHERAPEEFKVKLETTKGQVLIKLIRSWAPNGVDRFFNLVKIGYFEEVAFYRAIEGFVVQFGISGNPEVNQAWAEARIKDDPVKASNQRGFLTFAMAGPNSRTTQLFINLRDNIELNGQGFAPIGQVTEGLEVIDSLYTGYGEMAPRGKGPRSQVFNRRGNAYLKKLFPDLDYIMTAAILE